MEEKLKAFERLLNIMDELRAKCPWDMKQTMETLRYLTIEETYELSDAIIEGDLEEIRKELGDVMLHLVFYSKIGEEKKAFGMAEVLNGICEKLIHRHPHIYGDVIVKDEKEVMANWEKIKLKEGKGDKSVLEGVPKSLPALVKAIRIQDKARGVGFDWDEPTQVFEKVKEEIEELNVEVKALPKALTEAEKAEQQTKVEAEFGDVLFSLINYARFIGVNPEDALERTNKKFIKRFQYLETESKKDGKVMGEMNLEEMDEYWNKAKTL
ncbi:MAG: nucleoside triphosphate pyrophosphohydrolase [Flavobacteriales bacterium]|nr:nucleoside triphosphate pyrophosphohydrolase [Flavobacteriales bacterium]